MWRTKACRASLRLFWGFNSQQPLSCAAAGQSPPPMHGERAAGNVDAWSLRSTASCVSESMLGAEERMVQSERAFLEAQERHRGLQNDLARSRCSHCLVYAHDQMPV